MTSRNPHDDGTNATAAGLLADMRSDPSGDFSPSIYETARLVTLTPSLRGHDLRLEFLLENQRGDGAWGGPDEYALVPTLSATEALLAALEQGNVSEKVGEQAVVRAIDRALRWLVRQLGPGREVVLPDTVAVEILVPALISTINERLRGATTQSDAGFGTSWRSIRLRPPRESNEALLDRIRSAVRSGHTLPVKLLHSLEVLGTDTCGAAVPVSVSGGLGCSPAATAAWLGDEGVRQGRPEARYLQEVQEPGTGAVPVAAPLGLFERAWILGTLAGAGIVRAAPESLLDSLRREIGETGAAGGDGLPPDADDTAAALHALALNGDPRPPDPLWTYWTEQDGGHVSCFPGERTPSTSTNAHALQAFATSLVPDDGDLRRRDEAMRCITGWLREQQSPDGYWTDKWHASPYYATACCTLALAGHGGKEAMASVAAAVRWVLDSQREDGSWGRWSGTYEETAYAVQILVRTGRSANGAGDAIVAAAVRGYEFLTRHADLTTHPPLWHDKDLYTPLRIVRAEGLAALHVARSDRRIAALLPGRDAREGNTRGSVGPRGSTGRAAC